MWAGMEGKRGEKEVQGSQGKVRRNGSHAWEGSGDCGIRVVIDYSGVSKSSRQARSGVTAGEA